ncbi:MAG: hypothetical protein M1839_008577 [Geoglossum umbratile]|nr:MAG: hypothetical protein M1839_008577 [Geoglossum umbratile]
MHSSKDPSAPINDSLGLRALAVTLSILGPLLKPLGQRVLTLGNFVLKSGSHISLSEAHTAQFVSKNTTIPVPRIITAFESPSGCRYILMTRLKGFNLSQVYHTMSESTQQKVLLQLRTYMNQLRSIEPPGPGHIRAVDHTPLHDERAFSGPCGPFNTVAEFHKALRGNIDGNTGHKELDQVIQTQDSRSYSLRLTHGDLSFRNILVEIDGTVSGFVDWECAGWYPDYWEYVSTYYSFYDRGELRPLISQFLEEYTTELDMERARRRLFNMM